MIEVPLQSTSSTLKTDLGSRYENENWFLLHGDTGPSRYGILTDVLENSYIIVLVRPREWSNKWLKGSTSSRDNDYSNRDGV